MQKTNKQLQFMCKQQHRRRRINQPKLCFLNEEMICSEIIVTNATADFNVKTKTVCMLSFIQEN